MGKSMDDIVLSYNDVVLRKSDLDILSGPFFLNDRIIEFYFSYLSSCYPSEDILLVPPSISFWVSNCPDKDGLKDFLEPLKLQDRKLVIFPVNNNDDVSEAEGGSHWSLLTFHRNGEVFVHHDSFGGFNEVHAKKLHSNVSSHMGISTTFMVAKTQQQMNGYDCGIYVCAITVAVIDWFYRNATPANRNDLWFDEVTPDIISNMRKEILKVIGTFIFDKRLD